MEQNPAPITTIREPELCGGLLDHFETLSPPPVRLEEAWRRFENRVTVGDGKSGVVTLVWLRRLAGMGGSWAASIWLGSEREALG